MEDVRIPLPPSPTKFLDQFRVFIRTDGKSYSTENTYVYWVKKFILFNNKAHPKGLGIQEVEAFLTHLSVAKDASPNTQKLALNALMFLYNRFLNSPIEQLNFKYAKKQTRTPTVFTHEEAMSIINCMVMPYKLLAQLMYGCGLRVSEALRLRVKDVDFAMGYIVIRDGKGFKDRTTLLPKSIIPDLKKQIGMVQNLLEYDKSCGIAGVYMPNMLEKNTLQQGIHLVGNFYSQAMNQAETHDPM